MNLKSSRGTNIVGVRAYNDRLILTVIRNSGQIPKIDIARKTGLSPTAVSAIVKQLEKNKLVKREKLERGRVGQPSMPFSINASGAYSLGLKIGRRSAELVLIDFLGEVIGLEILEYKFPEKRSIVQFAHEASQKLYATLSETRQKRIVGLGVAMPNEIWKWEKLFRTPEIDLSEWSDESHFATLQETLGLPVFPINDATAACGAELTLNNSLTSGSFIYFFIGWFIGGGVVIDNKLCFGQSDNSGALGSILVVDVKGEQKQLIYTSSISALEEKLIAKDVLSTFTWDDLAWQADEKIINEWIEESAFGIAQACAAANAVIDFNKVIIDGVMPITIRNKIFEATIKHYDRLDTTGMGNPEFLEGQIGPQARSIGAACLPLISSFSLDYDVLFKGTTSA